MAIVVAVTSFALLLLLLLSFTESHTQHLCCLMTVLACVSLHMAPTSCACRTHQSLRPCEIPIQAANLALCFARAGRKHCGRLLLLLAHFEFSSSPLPCNRWQQHLTVQSRTSAILIRASTRRELQLIFDHYKQRLGCALLKPAQH